jgi:arsenate reductase (glutaredoxin)
MGFMQLWHNARCSKSRGAKQILDGLGASYVERRYVDDPPTAAELDAVLNALHMQPWELIRQSEPIAIELNMKSWPHDRDRWIAAMVEHPVLIERPILITDDGRAIIGRPPELIEQFIR